MVKIKEICQDIDMKAIGSYHYGDRNYLTLRDIQKSDQFTLSNRGKDWELLDYNKLISGNFKSEKSVKFCV